MKGIELPISTIIVIILVLIVLVAILGLFYGVWPTGAQAATLESVKDNACQMLVSSGGCGPDSVGDHNTKHVTINNFDADKNGRTVGGTGVAIPHCNNNAGDHDNLFTLCECWYNLGGTDDVINSGCKKMCGCPMHN